MRRRTPLFAALAAWLLTPAAATAQVRDGFKHLDFVVDGALFEEVCDLLHLSGEHRRLAAERFEAYQVAVRDIDDRTDAAMRDVGYAEVKAWEARRLQARMDAFMLERVPDFMRPEPPGEEPAADSEEELVRLQHLNYLTNKERLAGRQEADQYFRRWLAGLQESLEIDDDRMDHARRLIRRRLYRWDVRRRAPFRDYTASIDLVSLVAAASEPDEELHPLITMARSRTGDEAPPGERLVEILDAYELELDAVIERELREQARRPPQPDDKDWITPADPEWDDRTRTRARRVGRQLTNLLIPATRIAQLLETEVSVEAREAWLDRVHAAILPGVFRDRCVDDVLPWLRDRTDHTPEQIEAVERLYRDYLIQRRSLRRACAELGIRVMRIHFAPHRSPPGGDGPSAAALAFARRKLELHRLSKLTIRQMRSVMTPPQVEALNRDVFAHKEVQRYGPWIDRTSLETLGLDDEFMEPLRRWPL